MKPCDIIVDHQSNEEDIKSSGSIEAQNPQACAPTLYVKASIPFAEDPRLTTKDIYHNYWHCRDFEISNLWQRSVFLTAFLVLCFTVYGILGKDLIDQLKESVKVEDAYWYVVNGVSFMICVVGSILSCLWIMMAKGSKAWYEIYENAITAFEGKGLKEKVDTTEIFYLSFNPVGMGSKYTFPKRDSKLSTGCAGAYSTSKINWAIGFLTYVIWSFLMVVHAGLMGFGVELNCFGSGAFAALVACLFIFLLNKGMRNCKMLNSEAIEERTELKK